MKMDDGHGEEDERSAELQGDGISWIGKRLACLLTCVGWSWDRCVDIYIERWTGGGDKRRKGKRYHYVRIVILLQR